MNAWWLVPVIAVVAAAAGAAWLLARLEAEITQLRTQLASMDVARRHRSLLRAEARRAGDLRLQVADELRQEPPR